MKIKKRVFFRVCSVIPTVFTTKSWPGGNQWPCDNLCGMASCVRKFVLKIARFVNSSVRPCLHGPSYPASRVLLGKSSFPASIEFQQSVYMSQAGITRHAKIPAKLPRSQHAELLTRLAHIKTHLPGNSASQDEIESKKSFS